jgi:ATP-dependent DNA helicase RecQ
MRGLTPKWILRERFGLLEFRGQQEAVIDCLLRGESALALFPTGAGKSLCYQLPALMLEGVTLVVSPLIALMKDQVESLQRRGIAAARLDSTLADDELAAVMEELHDSPRKLLFLSPERLASKAFLRSIRGLRIDLLAIDEAHCLSEWGHNFRPDYLKMARITRKLGVGRVLALTATATPKVAREIRKHFRIKKEHQFHSDFHRPNLHLSVEAQDENDKPHRLCEYLQQNLGPTIVYATSRQDTETLAALLQQHGFRARAYHAGLPASERSLTQDAFLRNETRIVVATIAFGMGIDKPDIRHIIHYHLPKSLEGYSQEIGRAGRDGKDSHCLLFADRRDVARLENFIHAATPSPQSLRNLLDRILRLADPGKLFAISPYELSISNDMREETLRTVIAYLELAGLIERNGSFHAYFRVRLLRPLEKILSGYAAREKKALRNLLNAAESRYGSLHFPLYEISEQTGMSRETIAEHITALAQAGDIRLEQRSIREVYKRCKNTTVDIAEEIRKMLTTFASRAEFEFERIQQVIRYVDTKHCRAQHLAKHFGMATPPCGLCDPCQGKPAIVWPDVEAPAITDEQWQTMLDLKQENHAALATPRQLAKFLCGIHSPASHHAKLTYRPEFGLWRSQKFHHVLAMLEA